MSALERELAERLSALGPDQRRLVLDYARALGESPIRGVPGTALKRFAGTISAEDAREIKEAIEEGCENVDPDAW
jgi:hypothetical protein